MKFFTIFFLSIFITVNFSFSKTKGHLVIIGGGSKPVYVMKKFVEFAGGANAKIAVVPNATAYPLEAFELLTEALKEAGCSNVIYVYCSREQANSDTSLEKLDNVTGVFFAGGDQSMLTGDLLGTKLLERIKEIYFNGGVVGGTSAGAAVMSKVMITGNELLNKDSSSTFVSIKKNNIETVEGFGFVDKAIIDQHFIKRKRHNRLISVVLEYPDLAGVGIDESTSIIVNPDETFEVLGESEVIIYNASSAKDIGTDKNGHLSAHGITMDVLKSGDKYNLNTKSVIE